MRFKLYLLLCFLFPAVLMAQNGTIRGKVISADLQVPLAEASVFLSNATYGTATAKDGTFTLQNVKPGQYELVVSYVGYEPFQQTVMVTQAAIDVKVEMHLKSYGLGEVTVVRHKFSKENFAMFVKDFIGDSPNAKQCKVVNPKAIDLVYRSVDKVLEGHSDDFLIIDNKGLGYRVKYLIHNFKSDNINYTISYEGKVLYEDLKGSKSQIAKWHKKREEAYYGSNMHFMRSLLHLDLDAQGFVIRQLVRKPNRERPAQLVILKNQELYYNARNKDSLDRWNYLASLPKYHETLIRQPMHAEDILRRTEQPDIYAMTFPDYLYVTYTKKRETVDFKDLYRPLDMDNFATSIITLYKPYAIFDLNGIVMSDHSVLYEGSWSKDRVAEQLPVDYVPGP